MLVQVHYEAPNTDKFQGIVPVRVACVIAQILLYGKHPGWTMEVTRLGAPCPRVDKQEEAAVKYEGEGHDPERSD